MSLKRVNANHFDEKMEMRTGRRTIEKENIIAAVYSFLEIHLIACQLKILVKKSEKKLCTNSLFASFLVTLCISCINVQVIKLYSTNDITLIYSYDILKTKTHFFYLRMPCLSLTIQPILTIVFADYYVRCRFTFFGGNIIQ